MSAQQQTVAVVFKDGRRLFGVWAPGTRSLAAPLFRELAGAESHLDCGISRLYDGENAARTAEDVEVRLLGEAGTDTVLLATQASWPEAFVVGPLDA